MSAVEMELAGSVDAVKEIPPVVGWNREASAGVTSEMTGGSSEEGMISEDGRAPAARAVICSGVNAVPNTPRSSIQPVK